MWVGGWVVGWGAGGCGGWCFGRQLDSRVHFAPPRASSSKCSQKLGRFSLFSARRAHALRPRPREAHEVEGCQTVVVARM